MKNIITHKTIKTVCGKTITFYEEAGGVAKAHSVTGPAIIYPKDDAKTSEYYLYGIKYSKTAWQSLISQYKAVTLADALKLEY